MSKRLFTILWILLLIIVIVELILWNTPRLKLPWQWPISFSVTEENDSNYLGSQNLIFYESKSEDNIGYIEFANPDEERYYRKNSVSAEMMESNVSVYIDIEQFGTQLRQANKQCHDVENPITFWKSKPSPVTNFTADMDFLRIELAAACGGMLYSEYLTTPPVLKMYQFEASYLSEPPVWDERKVSSHKHSTIRLAGSNSDFKVGDTVNFVIKIADREGRPKVRGGDRLKVLLKDVKFEHSISTQIKDFDNGTYLATTILPWAGTLRVIASLRHPREYIRALIYSHRAHKSTLPFAGAYINDQASEGVPCSAFPIVPGFNSSELCNLTLVNGPPWYCGRPSKVELNCSDFHLIRSYMLPLEPPVTPAEKHILSQSDILFKLLDQKIVLNVEPAKLGVTRLKDPDLPCNKVPPEATWQQAIPPGYFYNKTWRSFLCRLNETTDPSCFKNVHMIFYGDSNSRSSYVSVLTRTKCKESLPPPKTTWHAPKMCINTDNNFTVQCIYHSSPFRSGYTRTSMYNLLQSPKKLFDSIPSTGRYIISFNHYLHYTSSHISAYEDALVSVRDALKELLNRNHNIQVILRAPHIAQFTQFTHVLGDHMAEHYHTLQREIFKDLQESIIYLPTWDMTVASQDTEPHPSCNDHIAHVLLQFVCGRK